MQRVTRSHMLDTNLYDFAGLTLDAADGADELDIAFDPPALRRDETAHTP